MTKQYKPGILAYASLPVAIIFFFGGLFYIIFMADRSNFLLNFFLYFFGVFALFAGPWLLDLGLHTRKQTKIAQEITRSSSNQFDRKATLEKIINRYSEIELTEMAKLLEMDLRRLQLFLLDLPTEYGFIIHRDVVKFNHDQLVTHIDDLLEKFDASGSFKL